MILLVFLIGVVIGSFINVFIDRSILEESLIYPPSHCDYCKNSLKIRNLIPIVSYILQKGKCTYCEKKLSIQYPIIEFITGIIFLTNYILLPNILLALLISLVCSLLLGMAVIDVKTRDIYIFHLLILLITNIFLMYFTFQSIEEFIYKLIIILLLVGIGYLLSIKNKLGFGDILIIAILLLNLSFHEIIIYLFTISIVGFIVGLILLIKFKDLKYQIPFVPIISISYLIVVLYVYKYSIRGI